MAVVFVMALAGAGSLGCGLTPREGVLACDDDGDCPTGWYCLDDAAGRHCYASRSGLCEPGVWDETDWDEGCWQ